MNKLMLFLFCIVFSFEGLAEDSFMREPEIVLSLSECAHIGCIFEVIPASLHTNRIWVQSRLPTEKEGSGKLNGVYILFENSTGEKLKVPIKGYVSQPDGSYYISEFEVNKDMLKYIFITFIYGAEQGGKEEIYRIVGLEKLLSN
ncbi:hypothetical protein [Microbulbifer variabilis]|uniref:hypothetical protein n=1 Tax=Microbulbifer variabilis TaxID=266805 RepID=UPI001CFD425E|nr:hypothetical protein [Microbulbifer variabilis]